MRKNPFFQTLYLLPTVFGLPALVAGLFWRYEILNVALSVFSYGVIIVALFALKKSHWSYDQFMVDRLVRDITRRITIPKRMLLFVAYAVVLLLVRPNPYWTVFAVVSMIACILGIVLNFDFVKTIGTDHDMNRLAVLMSVDDIFKDLSRGLVWYLLISDARETRRAVIALRKALGKDILEGSGTGNITRELDRLSASDLTEITAMVTSIRFVLSKIDELP